ncbi:hypothetical protein CRG98_014361, partial [Punica granatum]
GVEEEDGVVEEVEGGVDGEDGGGVDGEEALVLDELGVQLLGRQAGSDGSGGAEKVLQPPG